MTGGAAMDRGRRTGNAPRRPSSTPRIAVLRPVAPAPLLSAQLFDDLFTRHLGPVLNLRQPPFLAWCDEAIGPDFARRGSLPRGAAQRFTAAVRGADFISPAYHCLAVTPLLMALRNVSDASVRFLVVAHAPAAYVLEWALMAPLLRPGDRIIAPTRSAASVIGYLCPEIQPFVSVVAHPVHALPAAPGTLRNEIVVLSRIRPDKLVHRLLDAVALLRDRGREVPPVRIAGPLTTQGTEHPTRYARALAARILRLGLTDRVSLVGTLDGERDRGRLLSGARVLVNLSVCVEESFGKAVVEALALGTPGLATAWNGLPETVGAGGVLVGVQDTGQSVDVPATAVAAALEQVLDSPPASADIARAARRSDPELVRRGYLATLDEALATFAVRSSSAGAPSSRDGLLARTAPLSTYRWEELFGLHVKDSARFLSIAAGARLDGPSDGERLRLVVLGATRRALELHLAGLPSDPLSASRAESDVSAASQFTHGATLSERLGPAARSPASVRSRLACLEALAALGPSRERDRWLADGVEALDAPTGASAATERLRVELVLRRKGPEHALRVLLEREPLVEEGEYGAARMRQLARVCREAGMPELAVPLLQAWLRAHPDAPESGWVWLDLHRAVRGVTSDGGGLEEQIRYRVAALLGEGATLQ